MVTCVDGGWLWGLCEGGDVARILIYRVSCSVTKLSVRSFIAYSTYETVLIFHSLLERLNY